MNTTNKLGPAPIDLDPNRPPLHVPDKCEHGTPGCHPCQQCDEAPPQPPAPEPQGGAVKSYARNQKCGCIVCICEDEVQCQGCGATHCGTHPLGQIPDAIYDEPAPTAPQQTARE